jgi:hypothetical protein
MRLEILHNTVSRFECRVDDILSHLLAEIRSRINSDIPKVVACLGDNSDWIREAALKAIGALSRYCEWELTDKQHLSHLFPSRKSIEY